MGCAQHVTPIVEMRMRAEIDRTERRQVPDRDQPTQAYVKIRDLIVSAELSPGSVLIGAQVADRIGLDRMAARSALRRLAGEGYVSKQALNHYSRLVVSPLTADDY